MVREMLRLVSLLCYMIPGRREIRRKTQQWRLRRLVGQERGAQEHWCEGRPEWRKRRRTFYPGYEQVPD